MDGADLLSNLQAYDQYEDLLGDDSHDDADDDSLAAHAAAAGGSGGADGDDRQLYSNPLLLLPQATPAGPVSPAAVSSWSLVSRGTPAGAQAAGGAGDEGRGAAGQSGWEAIYIDYQVGLVLFVADPLVPTGPHRRSLQLCHPGRLSLGALLLERRQRGGQGMKGGELQGRADGRPFISTTRWVWFSLSLLPQVTPVRPVSPAAVSSWSLVSRGTPAGAQAAGGAGGEGRGAAGQSGWEAIYIDYQVGSQANTRCGTPVRPAGLQPPLPLPARLIRIPSPCSQPTCNSPLLQAPWPVSAVVPPSALQGYNHLFRFLLAARRTHMHLALAWSALQLTRGLKVEGTMLQRVHWLRHRMACAVTAILDHMAHAVISPNFDFMTSKLTKATSFHQ
ncbi:unnamed protein product, partial [Closterium sp. NIES-53]